MNQNKPPYGIIILIIASAILGATLGYCHREEPIEPSKAKLESIRLEEQLKQERLNFEKALSEIMPDTVIIEIDRKQKADEKEFNSRIIDIVGLDANGTIATSAAVISKGDSIRAGHLNLVHPR
jgi:hypothetical protein